MKKIKAGLLPLYIKLYDDSLEWMRPKVNAFHEKIYSMLFDRGIDVVDVPVCRIKSEFELAIAKFEKEDCDAIVTLNLAYSPSLEASDAIAGTNIPVIVLDTTPDYVFDQETDPVALDFNHGIHGVQDLCNMMRRNGKPYVICAGHYEKSDVVDRVVEACKAAVVAKSMKTAKVGMVGEPFKGMGDFELGDEKFKKTIGFDVIRYTEKDVIDIPDSVIDKAYDEDCKSYKVNGVDRELYRSVEKVGLSIANWIEKNKLTGYTMNFLESKAGTYFGKMPFAQASKSLASGVGYAGEGDVMTAAFVGSLLKIYDQTSFCEMFCPNWRDGSIYLNHMGEFNPACSTGDLTMNKMNFNFTDAGDTYTIVGTFKPGKSVFVCIAPQKDDKFTLIICPGEMLAVDPEREDTHIGEIHGWFKPSLPVADFLEAYSREGGIHHASMIWDGDVKFLQNVATLMGWNSVVIK